ncbi:unnamed protein product [Camellia sinensis]
MADIVKQILAKPIQLPDQVIKTIDEASSFKFECFELKSKTEKLVTLLRQKLELATTSTSDPPAASSTTPTKSSKRPWPSSTSAAPTASSSESSPSSPLQPSARWLRTSRTPSATSPGSHFRWPSRSSSANHFNCFGGRETEPEEKKG